MTPVWARYAIGYSFALVVGHFIIAFVVGRLWASIGMQPKDRSVVRPGWWLAPIVGVIERLLYLEAFLQGVHAFVGIWLAMKLAGEWQAWREGIKTPNGYQIRSHSIYMVFMTGNGLSILYAAVGAYFVQGVHARSFATAILLLSVTGIVWFVAYHYREEWTKDREYREKRP